MPRGTRPAAVRDVEAARLVVRDVLAVRVQVLHEHHFAHWPTERRPVDPQYGDVPPVTLRVPTRAAFVAMKASAWSRRRASRDLYDLWVLARAGAVDDAAVDAFVAGTGSRPYATLLGGMPADDWTVALAHQTADVPTVDEALRVVREAFAALDRE